ncbi:MAG: 50S ribosomal protein L9 [Bacteriovoracaceae bacterium]|nr:50S ribosomal protein L9 [Bacteriovoracaceae bacterium]
MKVILTEKVKSLGGIGETVNVTAGYARNFLFPNKFAVVADKASTAVAEDQKKRLAKKIAAEKKIAQELSAKVNGITLEFSKRVGSNGKLFGAITGKELSEELLKRGLDIEKRLIHMDGPIKGLGQFSVKVKLFTDIDTAFNVKVVMDEKQIQENKELQAAGGSKKKNKKKEAKDSAVTEESGETAGQE